MIKLIIAPAFVEVTERGATVQFMGGRLWLRPDLAKKLSSRQYASVELVVSLRNVSASDGRRYDAVFVQSLGEIKP